MLQRPGVNQAITSLVVQTKKNLGQTDKQTNRQTDTTKYRVAPQLKIRQQKNEIELFCLLAERTIILKREDKECRYHEVFKKDKLNFPKENLHCYVGHKEWSHTKIFIESENGFFPFFLKMKLLTQQRVTLVIKRSLKSQTKIEYNHSPDQNVFLVHLD